MLKNYIKENKVIFSTLILVVLSLSSLIFSIKLLKIRKNIIARRQDLAFEKSEVARLDQAVLDYESEEPNIKRALSSLPQTYEQVAALAYKIESIANSNGLTTVLSFDKIAKDEGPVSSLKIVIKTEGGYQNYTKFISSLSNLPYNSVLTDIKMNNEKGLAAETTIKVYIRK